ncbi:MAG TPA: pilin [Candidatus Paceibacterota bacterium]|nr:pilin [Candidatus Paceibacterota bacterium]
MKKLLLAGGIGLALLVLPVVALATADQYPYAAQTSNTIPVTGGVSNTIPVTGGTQSVSGSGSVINPLGGINSFCGLIKALLSAAVAIGIPIAVLFIVWAGLKFVLAQGNSTKLADARKNMLWTVIGIGIFLGAWLLAMVIQNTVNGLASGSGQSVISSCN